MRKQPVAFFALLLSLISRPCEAQLGVTLDSMQNPPGLSWKQITTPHFNIVFPAAISQDAQQVANLLEHVYEADGRSLNTKPRKISLVLHNQNTESNGFVTLAPRQSEWFNTPPQVGLIGFIPWYQLLAVHEFRHVVQYDRSLSGMTKWLYYLFGDLGHAVGAFFNLPAWVWEGDAVVMETALTHGGRGRMPEFTMPIRTMLLTGDRFSYYKMIFGSYRDWSADPYSFGYLMVSRMRRQKGAMICSDVIGSTMALATVPYRFSWSLRRKTGKAVGSTYQATMDELKVIWHDQTKDIELTDARQINHSDRFLTHYLYPKTLPDRSVLVLKFGLGDRYSLTRLATDGSEKKIHLLGNTTLEPPSAEKDKIVWSERIPHPRWGYLDYSCIKIYDLNHHKERRLTSKSKWMAPTLSKDGRRIAAVEHTPENRCQLVLLDAETGHEIKRFANPQNAFLMTPAWSPDNQHIVLNTLTNAGRSLSLVNLQSGEWQDLIECSARNTSLPVFFNDYVLFNWDYSGIDNIYAIHRDSKEIWQVTSRPYGAFHPAISADGHTLYFNDYTLHGYQVAAMPLETGKWKKLEHVTQRPFDYHEPIVQQEAGPELLTNIPNRTHVVKNYQPLKDAIRIHSWLLPIAGDTDKNITAQCYSQNLLGTLGMGLGFTTNENEKTNAYHAMMSYAGWYPIVDISGQMGKRTASYTDFQDKQQLYSWREQGISLGLRLPLNLTRDVYLTQLSAAASAALTKISDKEILENHKNNNGTFAPVSYSLNFFRGYQWMNEVYPHFGQSLMLLHRHVPFKSDYRGRLSAALLNLYFPGFARHHGWRWQLAAEKQQAKTYRFENELHVGRGYSYQFHDFFYRGSVDYGLPLTYPDWNGLGLIYLKKIVGNFFYDYVWARTGEKKSRYQSTGVELLFHGHWLSTPLELPIGARMVYLIKEKKWRAEFLLALEL